MKQRVSAEWGCVMLVARYAKSSLEMARGLWVGELVSSPLNRTGPGEAASQVTAPPTGSIGRQPR